MKYFVALFALWALTAVAAKPVLEERATECLEDCIARCNLKTGTEQTDCLTGCESKSPCTTSVSSTTTTKTSTTTTKSSTTTTKASTTTTTTKAASSTTTTKASSATTTTTKATSSSTSTKTTTTTTKTTKTSSQLPTPTSSIVYPTTYPVVGFATLNGGVTGGVGGPEYYVTTAADFITAVKPDTSKIVYVAGTIDLTSRPSIGNNTSIIGVGAGAIFNGQGMKISSKSNIVIRNIRIVKAVGEDSLTITTSNNIWIDHCEFESDRDHGVDYYDGLVDVTKGCDYVTISYNKFLNHYKASLVGGDPALTGESGKYHITYHHNYWFNISTRGPALRFAQAHIFNNYYQTVVAQGVHTRSQAQALIEYNVFTDTKEAISTYGKVIPEDSPNTSPDGDYEPDGFANVQFNDYGGATINITQVGTMTSVPYTYSITALTSVKDNVLANAGLNKIF